MIGIRALRILLLIAIAITGVATAAVYLARHRVVIVEKKRQKPVAPLDSKEKTKSNSFTMSHTEGGKTIFKATAKNAIESRDTGKSKLEELQLEIYGRSGDRHDRITSKSGDYDSNAQRFYSDGEVQIYLSSVPGSASKGDLKAATTEARQEVKGAPPAADSAPPVEIETTGLLYDQKKGVASTERPLSFQFRNGTGQATGAVYDGEHQLIWLQHDVVLHVHRGKPVDITAAELRNPQKDHVIYLTSPVFRRPLSDGGTQVITAERGTVLLDEKQQAKSGLLEGSVHAITEDKGRTTDIYASLLEVVLDSKQHVTAAVASGNVRLDSRSPNGRTQGEAPRLEMDMTGANNALKVAQWKGGTKLTITPPPNQTRAQTRVITADQIEMVMKPDGKEMASARTLTPGRVEMTGGNEPKRVLTAQQLSAIFGDRDVIRELHGAGRVHTDTDPPLNAKAGTPPRSTSSDRLDALFNAQQQIETVTQSGTFQYHEGDRQATAEQAVYTATPGANPPTGTTILTGKAGSDPLVWDPEGRVQAKKITMPEGNGETVAEGDVRVMQLPAKDDKKKRATIFSGAPGKNDGKTKASNDDPTHALTNRLRWDRQSGVSHYEGGPNGKTRVWQGQDFLEARTVDMERNGKKVSANGDVYSMLVEQGKAPLRVTSQRLNYNDDVRHARYEGDVVMRTQDMTVTAFTVDAWLRDADQLQPGESRLEKSEADGKVHFTQPPHPASEGKKAIPARQSDSEHAVYTSDDDKIVLTGGPPVVRDELRGSITGRELTWLTSDDKIFVDSGPDVRTLTQQRVTKKPR